MRKLLRQGLPSFITLITMLTLLLAACASPRTVPAPVSTASLEAQPLTSPTSSLAVTQTAANAAPDLILFQGSLSAWTPGKPPVYPDSTAASVAVSSDHTLPGGHSLTLVFEYKEGVKAIFSIEKPVNLSTSQRLYVLLADPDGVLDAVTVAISTGADWLWQQAVPQKAQAGDNTFTFDLQSTQFETAATGWKSGAKVANLGQVQRISIILFPKKAGAVFLQSMRTSAEEPGSGATAAGCPPLPQLPESQPALALYLPKESNPQQYGLVEFDLASSTQAQNPFDPAQIDLEVNYTAPDGTAFSLPAFWYQAYDAFGATPCGNPGWKARLTPTQVGEWTAQAELTGKGIKSELVTFQVAPSISKGFVRINSVNPRYLAFDNGQTFFPIGLNIGWWQVDPLKDYQRWMDRLHANGGSAMRVWMADWSFGIEWNDTGLGDYTRRLRQAWLLDQVFAMASQNNIYIDLVLLHHGPFSKTVNAEWDSNPYNAANGGPCAEPECFATDAAAKAYFQRRLRYIAARWGYSTNLLAWEWWNEEDWTPITPDLLAPWIREMTAYLRQFDPYHHLVTTSFASKNSPLVLGLPEVDITQVHAYDMQDPMDTFPGMYKDMTTAASGKPVLFGEFGYSAGGENTKSFDKLGDHLHAGLWAATFSGFASPAMYWWWDSYIDPLNLWGQYKELATFLQNEDMAVFTPGQPKVSSPQQAKALSLQNSVRALVWIKSVNYIAAQLTNLLEKKVQGFSVTLTGLEDGSYRVQWYDPFTSQWLSESTAQVHGGSLALAAPDFNRDLAVKLEKIK